MIKKNINIKNDSKNNNLSKVKLYNPLELGIDLDGEARKDRVSYNKKCNCPCSTKNEAAYAAGYVMYSPIY